MMSSCFDNARSCQPCVPVESTAERLADDLAGLGRRILAVYGESLPASVRRVLEDNGKNLLVFEMSGAEPGPLVESVGVGASICRHEKIDVLLTVGGETARAFAVKIAESFRRLDPSGQGLAVGEIPASARFTRFRLPDDVLITVCTAEETPVADIRELPRDGVSRLP